MVKVVSRAAGVVLLCLFATGCARARARFLRGRAMKQSLALQVVTLNTGAYTVAPKAVDLRSESILADEDMHIVAIEHFIGVAGGAWSDNGHLLSLEAANPWEKWAGAGTGMEPTGTRGYFGYCGRDYYSEVGGIPDVTVYEALPAGTHILVPKGQRLYMHMYAHNFNDAPRAFHHAVRVLYW